MAFWSDSLSPEPKRSFRWTFTLGTGIAGATIQTYFVKTVQKPSFAVTSIPHQFVQHTFYYPGRLTWNPVDVTFVDPVDPDTSTILANIVADSGYRIPSDPQVALESMSKREFIQNVGTPTIQQIDAEGIPIETWTLHNAFVESLNFGDLSYEADELVVLAMTLRYDYATLNGTSTPSRLQS
tara:strand:+ start:48 stop:593 length:546 start_codon:yes stop_codon:yes gene_type:complete